MLANADHIMLKISQASQDALGSSVGAEMGVAERLEQHE